MLVKTWPVLASKAEDGPGAKSCRHRVLAPDTMSQRICKLILEVRRVPHLALVVTARRIKWFLVLRVPLPPHIKGLGLKGEGDLMFDLRILTLLIPGPEVGKESLNKLSQAPGGPQMLIHTQSKTG